MKVYQQDEDQYASFCLVADDGRGPVLVVQPDGTVTERNTLPFDAFEVISRDAAREEMLPVLDGMTLSKTGRASVEKALHGWSS